ncbi:ImmA/IrrE family metallo-endopeptidase [Bradyrhizobium sp. BR 1432]|uniref:ImmA/IrrE family metallo-endopeptidase n=1 Tax=Bradyrhizobium sp. BR 1432 TaxID=3447966 RepID=UPI003EE59F97
MTKQTNRACARTDSEIRAVAQRLRRALLLTDQHAINVVDVVEFGLPKLIPDFTLSIVKDDDLPSDTLALAREDPPEIIVRESVYYEAAKHEPRARWIIAHEIGHIILLHGKVPLRGFPKAPVDVASAEHQANLFARYFLVAQNLAEGCNSPSAIATKFQVTNSAARACFEENYRQFGANLNNGSIRDFSAHCAPGENPETLLIIRSRAEQLLNERRMQWWSSPACTAAIPTRTVKSVTRSNASPRDS